MWSSCMPCCGRPRTYKRLTDELYRKSAQDKRNPDIQCNTRAIETLVDYSAAYPQKLSLVVDCLEEQYISSILREEHGWVILTIETFRALARKFHRVQLLHMLEVHLNLVLRCAIQSYRVAYMQATAKLLKDCIRLDAFSSELDFVDAILDLCETPPPPNPPDASAGESASQPTHHPLRFMGCTLLTALLRVLYSKPGYLAHRVERIAAILLHSIVQAGQASQTLSESKLLADIPQLGEFLSRIDSCSPRSMEELGWKAWHELCSAASEEIWVLLFEQTCLFFIRQQISFLSFSFYKVLIVVTASKNPFQHCAARTPKFLMDVLFSQFAGQKAAVHRVEDLSAWANAHCVQEGAEPWLRNRHSRMTALDDGLQFVALWIRTESARLACLRPPLSQGPRLLGTHGSFMDWLASLKQCVQLIAMVIKAVPAVVQYDVFKSQWLGRLQHDDSSARMRDLPSSLRLFHGVNIFTHRTSSEPIELDILACKVLESVFQAVQSLTLHTSPLGGGGLALLDALYEHVHSLGTAFFVGQLETNVLSQYFQTCVSFLSQVWMSNIRLDICAPHLPCLSPPLPWSLTLSLLRPFSAPLPVFVCANFEVHRHFFLALVTSLLLPSSPSSPLDPGAIHTMLSFLWRYLQRLSQLTQHPVELANYLCVCSEYVHALFHALGPQACLQALPMLLTMESQWKEISPSQSSSHMASARFCWQALFLSFLLSLAEVAEGEAIQRWVSQAWPSLGTRQIVVVDPSDSRLRPADKMLAELGAVGEGGLEVDRRELLGLCLACPAWQAMHSLVYEAFSVVFDPREESAGAEPPVCGEEAAPSLTPGAASLALLNDGQVEEREEGAEEKTEDDLTGREVRERDERWKEEEEKEEEKAPESSEEDRLLAAAWQDGYSIAQESALRLASPSWPNDSEDPAVAIPSHVRTQNWKKEYQSQVSLLQETTSSLDQLLPEVLSTLT